MKVYITRRGRPDFVCDAPTIGDAIVMFWLATKESPKASYRVHFGRRRQSRVVSSAIAYWQLSVEMRSALVAVIEEQSTPQQYRDYCEIIITAGHLLGR